MQDSSNFKFPLAGTLYFVGAFGFLGFFFSRFCLSLLMRFYRACATRIGYGLMG